MADITVKLYQFAKRVNSTALPTNATTSVDVVVLLKDNCSYEEPKLILNSNDPSSYNNYNYAYIQFLGRYYFIQSKELETGSRLILNLKEDYLGSFAADIKALTGVFIEYSSHVTNLVEDSRLRPLSLPNMSEALASLNNTTFTQNGFGVISSTGNKSSGLFILQNVDDIIDIFDGVDWSTITVPGSPSDDKTAITNFADCVVQAAEQFFTKDGAAKNIRSAFALPWVVHGSAIGSAVSNYVIGSFPTGKTVYKVAKEIVTDHAIIAIPWGGYSNWQRCDKFTDLIIYLPLFGLQQLPVDELQTDTSIRVTYAFSYSNGDVSYQIEGIQSHHIVATGSTNVSAPLAVGASNVNNTKLATSTAVALGTVGAAAAGALTGGVSIMAGLGAIGGSFMQTMDALGGRALQGGGFGGFAAAALDPVLHLWRFTKVFTDSPANMGAALGYPNGSVGNLSSLTGYCKLNYFSFAGNCTSSEKMQISNMLNSGFYLE